jgi:hypothetical protein
MPSASLSRSTARPRVRAAASRSQLAHRRVLIGEERGIRRQNAVFRGEANQFFDQLVVLAAEINLVDDLADAPHGPELLDEGMGLVVRLLHELGGKIEGLLFVAHFARDRHLGVASLLIAADHDQLLARE